MFFNYANPFLGKINISTVVLCQANRELDKISASFKTNKFLLNEEKTKYVTFRKKLQFAIKAYKSIC